VLACHGAGIAGAPKVGDKAQWGPRNRAGQRTRSTTTRCMGSTARRVVMPAKGGRAELAGRSHQAGASTTSSNLNK
jgi:cytochrome c